MKVESRKMKVGMLLFAIWISAFLGVYFYAGIGGGENDTAVKAGQMYALVRPTLAQITSTTTTFLEQEAGMSIYVNIGQSIDLSKAKTVYKTIEKETSDYIVGSLSLPNLPESEDVHCFVHKDGWVVVYYLKAEPISKIIDWNYWLEDKLTKNKLQVGLEQTGNALGIAITGAKYYHFQYPYANKFMLIIETQVGSGEDSFKLNIPSNFTVYERSWSHYSQYSYYTASAFKIDGNTISTIISEVRTTKIGQLTVAQLSPDVFHTVSISGGYANNLYGVGIALAYKEP